MSWINMGQVYYMVARAVAAAQAEAKPRLLQPLVSLDAVAPERVLAAARIKAAHPLAYADAFAIATATAIAAVLVTGDPDITGELSAAASRIWRRHATEGGWCRHV